MTERTGSGVDVDDRLSVEQHELCFLDRALRGSAALTNVAAYRLTGELDLDVLATAWRLVVARHDTLRMTIAEQEGRAVRVPTSGDSSLSIVDVMGRAGSDGDARIARWCAELADVPLILGNKPLVRITAMRNAPDDTVLLVVAHAAIADASSVMIIIRDLAALYSAGVAGRSLAGALPERMAGYRDYVRWQASLPATDDHRHKVSALAESLVPLPVVVAPTADQSRPSQPETDAGTLDFSVDAELGAQLRDLSHRTGTSRPTVLLAVLYALLFRVTGESRPAVGLSPDSRPGRGYTDVVGPFGGPVLANVELSGEDSFTEVLERLGRAVRQDGQHREVCFSELTQAMRVTRDPRRGPLCDVVFVVTGRMDDPVFGELRARRLPVYPGSSIADLVLVVDGDQLTGALRYREHLYRSESARMLLRQLHVMMRAALASPGLPLKELPLETAEERAAARVASDRIAGPPVGMTAIERIAQVARTTPTAIAIHQADTAWTYQEVLRDAGQVAAELISFGVAEGDTVMVRLARAPQQIAALLGVHASGACFSWFRAEQISERDKTVLTSLRPACVLVESEDDPLAAWYREKLGGRAVVYPDDTRQAAPEPVWRARLDATAYVAFTSGSTGRPKGVVQSHAALAQFVGWMTGEFGIRPGSRVAQWTSPEHDPALCEVFAALVAGATLCPVPAPIRGNPAWLVDWLGRERVSLLQLVPSAMREILRVITGSGAAARLGALTHILLAGEVLTAELANAVRVALPQVRLINIYGPTETIAATWYELPERTCGQVPIGQPIPGRQVLILDEHDQPCPAGVPGEIVIGSPYVTGGYLRSSDHAAFRPVATSSRSDTAVRWYRTGDLGRRRNDQLLEFRGRKDQQIKVYGNRLELGDLEAALLAHDSVADCAATVSYGPDGLPDRLAMLVVTTPGTAPTDGRQTWRTHLRQWFGGLTVPVTFHVHEGPLPRNPSGKIDRARLSVPAPDAAAPHASTEAEIREIWSELLGVDQIDGHQTFSALGGSSLLVPVLLARLRDRLGIDISLLDYLTAQTPAGLAALADSR